MSLQKCCHIKLWIIINVLSLSRVFNIIWILFYCRLYTAALDIVNCRLLKKWCIWSLHLRNFLWLPVFVLFLQKICGLSCNYLNFIYIYIYKIEIRISETNLPEMSVYSIIVLGEVFSLSVSKRGFIFYNSFSFWLTENLH